MRCRCACRGCARRARDVAISWHAEHGFWHRLALWVMRHPVAMLVPVLAFLLLLGAPYLSVRLAAPDASILPDQRQVARRVRHADARASIARADHADVIAVRHRGQPAQRGQPDRARYATCGSIEADPRVQRVTSIVSLDPRLTLRQYQLHVQPIPRASPTPTSAQSLATLAGDHITLVQVVSKYGMLDTRSEALVQAIRNTPPPGWPARAGGWRHGGHHRLRQHALWRVSHARCW